MTIFAGAYCINNTDSLPAALVRDLLAALRTKDDGFGTHSRYETTSFVLESWDSGAFREPAWHEDVNGVCKLAGDPLLEGETLSRAKQVTLLVQALRGGQFELLATSRGSFALVDYEAGRHKLILTTDHVGLRPIYYAVQDGVLVFATALRILESLQWLQRSLSPQGMTELSAFSFPLADRTPYAEISVLRECEIVLFEEGRIAHERYYDWAESSSSNDGPAAASASPAQLFGLFEEAVSMRVGGDRSVYSFLSGGMDSRSIVATLLNGSRHIEALNFSANASQDQYYAQQFAAEVGARLTLHCLVGGVFPNFSFLALAAKTELEKVKSIDVDRRQCIWSGDGGSVGLGHVYMDEAMLNIADQEGLAAVVEYFLKFNRIALPTKVMSRSTRRTMPRRLHEAVLGEMQRYRRHELGRQIYLFLLFNDQRRHLFKHFETIDQHGLELLTPFFDAKFLKAIVATPIRRGVLHRLYSEWFEHMPEVARRTRWQTYPGHVPCPIKTEEMGSYQWAKTHHRASVGVRLRVARQIFENLGSARKSDAFSTVRVALAAILHVLGLSNCDYIAVILEIYAKHVRMVSGSATQSRT